MTITVEEAYQRYLVEVEKNATNDNVANSRDLFCIIFNKYQNKFLSIALQQRGVDDVRWIQRFLILDKRLTSSTKTTDHYNFTLPEDYFDLADARAKAEKGKCKDLITLKELQTENLGELISDELNKPSFEWRESFYTLNSNQLSVYFNNFSISEILLNYYRYPNQIKVLDETRFDENSTIEWDDKALNEILNLTTITKNN